jgi:cullin 3
LQKSSKTKNILPTDKFKFNKSFTNPQYKIKIPMVSGRIEGSKELLKTREEIDETRKYLIDASIVRTMKDRKVLSLNLLIVQVTGQLKGKFKLSPNQIKLRIENLVEREYLIRDEEDR